LEIEGYSERRTDIFGREIKKPKSLKDCIYRDYKTVHGGTTTLCNHPDYPNKDRMFRGSAGEGDCPSKKCKLYESKGKAVVQTTLETV